MEKPEHTAPAPDAPQPTAESVDAKLDRIEKSIAQVNDKVDGIEKTLPKPDPVADKQASKATLATAFGFLGLKVLGVAGSHFFYGVFDAPKAFKRGGQEAVEQAYITLHTFGIGRGGLKAVRDEAKHGWYGGLIAAAVGLFGGALLGWARGDRVAKPGDLVMHPIDSIKKIFGPEPKKEKPEQTVSAEGTNTPATDTAAERNYHGKVQETPARELA